MVNTNTKGAIELQVFRRILRVTRRLRSHTVHILNQYRNPGHIVFDRPASVPYLKFLQMVTLVKDNLFHF